MTYTLEVETGWHIRLQNTEAGQRQHTVWRWDERVACQIVVATTTRAQGRRTTWKWRREIGHFRSQFPITNESRGHIHTTGGERQRQVSLGLRLQNEAETTYFLKVKREGDNVRSWSRETRGGTYALVRVTC